MHQSLLLSSKSFGITSNGLAHSVHLEGAVNSLTKILRRVFAILLLLLPLPLVLNPNLVPAVYHQLSNLHSPESGKPSSAQSATLQPVVLWAWERPEDLRFLDPKFMSVAFLAKTIYILPSDSELDTSRSAQFLIRSRLEPLRVPAGVPLIAVVRIETPPSARSASGAGPAPAPLAITAQYSSSLAEEVASEIASLQNLLAVHAIQIDFDATVRQRAFYAALLLGVRRKLPAEFPLSITALASWCIGDPWLKELQPGTIQEAVPMLFRMGPDAANVRNFLRSGQEFPVAYCQNSLGLSTDEAFSTSLLRGNLAGVPPPWRQKRIYVFSPRAWTQSAVDTVLKEWQP